MDNEEMTEEATVSVDQSLDVDAADDEFATIREHFEAGMELTDEETDKVADVAVEHLRSLLSFFGENNSSIDEYDGDNGELILDVNGGDLAVLIGKHGHTLDSLQMVLTSLMSSTLKFYYPITVDIESYKSRRKNKVQGLARSAAQRARKQGRVAMAPMNAYERRLVHLALVDDDTVTTHSEGVDPNRRVVITSVR